jgi:hypothetical protein
VSTDTLLYAFPDKWVGIEAWRQGKIALWNPTVSCGVPHLASGQSGLFYPPYWFWIMTGLWDWFYWGALAHVGWAAVGFFLWARQRRAGAMPSLLAALAFALSVQMTRLWGFPSHIAALSWMPWVFLAADRYLDRPGPDRWGLLVLCAGAQVLAGYPHIMGYTMLFLALWVGWRRPSSAAWGGLAFAAVAVLLLTAVHGLPVSDLFRSAYRPEHVGRAYSLKPVEWLTVLGPGALGRPGTPDYRGTLPGIAHLPSYVGWALLAVLSGALVGIARLKERFFLLSGILCLLWLLGMNWAPWRFLLGWAVGWLEPAKASVLWPFCASTAAATALSQAWPTVRRSRWGRMAAVLLVSAMAVEPLSVPFRVVRLAPDPFRDRDVVASAEFLRRMTDDGRMVSLRQAGSEGWSGQKGPGTVLWEETRQFFPNANAVFGLRACGYFASLLMDGYQNMLLYMQRGFPYEGRVLDAAGVRTFVLPDRLGPAKYRTVRSGGGLVYQTNRDAMPAAWCVSRPRILSDRPSVYRALMLPDAPLEDTVFLEGSASALVSLPPPRRHLGGTGSRGMEPGREPRGGSDRDPSPGRALFTCDGDGTGWLVYSESYAPGWRAWVDGAPAPIRRANGLFMAVALGKAGSSQVEFRYEPASFRLGLFLTLASCSAFLTFLLFRRRMDS